MTNYRPAHFYVSFPLPKWRNRSNSIGIHPKLPAMLRFQTSQRAASHLRSQQPSMQHRIKASQRADIPRHQIKIWRQYSLHTGEFHPTHETFADFAIRQILNGKFQCYEKMPKPSALANFFAPENPRELSRDLAKAFRFLRKGGYLEYIGKSGFLNRGRGFYIQPREPQPIHRLLGRSQETLHPPLIIQNWLRIDISSQQINPNADLPSLLEFGRFMDTPTPAFLPREFFKPLTMEGYIRKIFGPSHGTIYRTADEYNWRRTPQQFTNHIVANMKNEGIPTHLIHEIIRRVLEPSDISSLPSLPRRNVKGPTLTLAELNHSHIYDPAHISKDSIIYHFQKLVMEGELAPFGKLPSSSDFEKFYGTKCSQLIQEALLQMSIDGIFLPFNSGKRSGWIVGPQTVWFPRIVRRIRNQIEGYEQRGYTVRHEMAEVFRSLRTSA